MRYAQHDYGIWHPQEVAVDPRPSEVIGGQSEWRRMGASDPTEAAAVLLQEFKLSLGVAATRGWALLKLDRLSHFYSPDSSSASARRRSAQAHHRSSADAYYARNGPDAFTRSHSRSHFGS